MDAEKLKKTWDRFIAKRDTRSKKLLIEHYFPYVKKIGTNLSKKYNHKVSAEELIEQAGQLRDQANSELGKIAVEILEDEKK